MSLKVVKIDIIKSKLSYTKANIKIIFYTKKLYDSIDLIDAKFIIKILI